MPFGIPAGEGPPSVALIRDVEDHLRARRLRHGINSVSVGGDQAGALRIGHSDLVGLFDVLAIFRLGSWLYHGTEHDHAVAKRQLGVRDASIGVGVDGVLFESQRPAKPLNGGGSVAVAQSRNDSRFAVSCEWRHALIMGKAG